MIGLEPKGNAFCDKAKPKKRVTRNPTALCMVQVRMFLNLRSAFSFREDLRVKRNCASKDG